jgi:Protein of unknown function (DUF1822)
MNDNYRSNLKIDLDRIAHATAAKFASQHRSISKGRSVYLNTLAVCAVRQYLSVTCQLDLELEQGDSWQIGMQSILNVADLVIPNVGKIECLLVLPTTTEIQISADLDERIGYVIVQFSDDLTSVELRGFIDSAQPRLHQQSTGAIIALNSAEIQSIESLLELIYDKQVYNLQEFLAGILGTGWEPICQQRAAQIDATEREFALRNTLNLANNTNYDSIRDFTASKMINLRAKIANIPLLMMIGLSIEPDDGRVKVRIRIHAAGGIPMLPADLKLTLQADNGQFLSEIQYPEAMNFIQLQSFKLHPGTQFKIRVALDNCSFTESFIA